VLLCCRSPDLNAQKMQLHPYVGLSLPTTISLHNGLLHLRQKVGMTVGARFTVTFNQRFDAVTSLSYSPGYAMFHGAGRRVDVTAQSHLLTAMTGARYWLLSPARILSWEVHTGLGLVFGGQPAYKDLFENSTVSGIIGTTVRYQLSRMVGFRLRIQDRLYRIRFGSTGPSSSRSPLQISFALDLHFVESPR
jgi:hypothetical protein